MSSQEVRKYLSEHKFANKASLQILPNYRLQHKILHEFGIDTKVTKNMSKQNLIGLYRNLYLKGLYKVKNNGI